MAFIKRHHFKKRHGERHGERHTERHGERHGERTPRLTEAHELMQPEHTGSESAYLKSLVDSHANVTIVLRDGERLQGQIRYYDRYCFSIGPSDDGPKIFLRKENISYISEDQEPLPSADHGQPN
jgi:small nuclear ribonucleoprotein (snRNP)-like protein